MDQLSEKAVKKEMQGPHHNYKSYKSKGRELMPLTQQQAAALQVEESARARARARSSRHRSKKAAISKAKLGHIVSDLVLTGAMLPSICNSFCAQSASGVVSCLRYHKIVAPQRIQSGKVYT